jgi:hypothetical protein
MKKFSGDERGGFYDCSGFYDCGGFHDAFFVHHLRGYTSSL